MAWSAMCSRAVLVVLLVLAAWLGWRMRSSGQNWGDDFASYIMQAASLVSGTTDEFLRRNRFTVLESDYPMGPVAYPWGFPLMLAPAYRLRGIDLDAFKWVGTACFLASLTLFWVWLRRDRLGEVEALGLVAVLALNPWMAAFQDQIRSDLPFLLATLVVMLAAERTRGWPLGASMAAATMFRVQGPLLLVAWTLARPPAEGRRGLVGVWLGFLGGFAAIWVLLPPSSQGYLASYQGARLELMFANLVGYLGSGAELFPFLGRPITWGLTLAVAAGAWSVARRERMAIAYVILSLLPIVASPIYQGLRFMLPLLPALLYFAYRGVRSLTGRSGAIALVCTLAAASLVVTFRSGSENLARDRIIRGPYDEASQELFAAVRRHVPPDQVVVFFKPRAMRLLTGRDSIKSTNCRALGLARWMVMELEGVARDRTTPGARRIEQMTPAEVETCGGRPVIMFENRAFRLLRWPGPGDQTGGYPDPDPGRIRVVLVEASGERPQLAAFEILPMVLARHRH